MIEKLYFYISPKTNPYYNLAVESALLEGLEDNALILYLWQNENTVVIGKNQNPWAECRVLELIESSGKVARRISGGGAVYHDLGNLNFTFISGKESLSVENNLEIIKRALKEEGISASFSGRNDLLVSGKKVSGSAFYYGSSNAFHHGTLLVSSDLERVSYLLTPPAEKLISKGVKSVSSRVMNLKEISPDITIKGLSESILTSAEEFYGVKASEIRNLDNDLIEKLELEYSNWDYIFGKTIEFSLSVSGRLSFGNIEIQLVVERGVITDARVFTDSLNTEIANEIKTELIGVKYEKSAIEKALSVNKREEILSLFV